MTTDDSRTAEKSLGDVVGDVSTQASLLVREEIELAKTEIAEKAKSLARGSAVAIAAGVMLVFGLIYFFEAAAWFLNDLFGTVNSSPWLGFIIVFGFLLIIAAIAGMVGVRWIKRGAPPTPDLAIEEAKRTRAELLEHN
jgi:Mg/Co/Ni transporter MgtE